MIKIFRDLYREFPDLCIFFGSGASIVFLFGSIIFTMSACSVIEDSIKYNRYKNALQKHQECVKQLNEVQLEYIEDFCGTRPFSGVLP